MKQNSKAFRKYLLYIVILAMAMFILQCNNKKNTNPKSIDKTATKNQLNRELADTFKIPTVVNIDTCPKPQQNRILKSGSKTIKVQTATGLQEIKITPPTVVPLNIKQEGDTELSIFGEGGGISYMEKYNTEQGLALSSISFGHKSSICDKDGNLWFGTNGGGVSKYDGKTFTNFTITQGLASNNVQSILEDRHGNIWFGTYGGVTRYDGKSLKNFTVDQGLANNYVVSIAQDKKGYLWFGTFGGGVSRFDGKEFKTFTIDQGLASNKVMCITEDRKGNLWIGTFGGGVSCYDGKTFKTYTTDQGLVNNMLWYTYEDSRGNIWFATNGGGISLYDGKTFRNFNVDQGLPSNVVWNISEDKKGNLWFGTNAGVSRLDYSGLSKKHYHFTNFTSKQGLANDGIRSVVEDHHGNIWFGTFGGGLSRYDGKAFTNFNTECGLSYNYIVSIIEDRNGDIWLGTNGGGLSKYDGKSFTNYTINQGLVHNNIRSLTIDSKGRLWMGTGNGLSCYDGETFTNYTKNQGLIDNNIISIYADKKDRIWIGTFGGGLSCFDGKYFINFTTNQGLSGNYIRCIVEDQKGSFWFGTDNGISGLHANEIDNFINRKTKNGSNHFKNFTVKDGLPNNDVYTIIEDQGGYLWIGTSGSGISRYDGKTFLNYSMLQGLADNNVMSIKQDSKGVIWAGTNLGISGLSFKSTQSKLIPAGNVKVDNNGLKHYKPVWEIYNISTGYPIKDVNGGSNNGAMLYDSKGIFWFGTGDEKTALVRFDRNEVIKSNLPPVVRLQNIKVNNQDIGWNYLMIKHEKLNPKGKATDSITNSLKRKEDSLTIVNEEVITFGKQLTDASRENLYQKFSAVQFDSLLPFYAIPQNLVLPYSLNNITIEFNAIIPGRHFLVRYQYMLEGYDKDWSPITSNSEATFGNIYEGTYTFKVRACSPDGVWSKPITYTFTVLPPWYRTYWAYAGYILGLVLLFYLLLKINLRRLEKANIKLEAVVQERTAEVVKQKEEIEDKNKIIIDSIEYAKTIQDAILPTDESLNSLFKEHFVLFLPKDIVSGDFYWVHHSKSDKLFWAVADCTGHGVSGAFMTMIGNSLLNEIIIKNEEENPGLILDQLRESVIKTLNKDIDISDADRLTNGMDLAVCAWDKKTNTLNFAGANISAYIIREAELIEIKGDRQPIGIHKKMNTFTNQNMTLMSNDIIYLLSDGYTDQFGGEEYQRFKISQIKQLLLNIYREPMNVQQSILYSTHLEWKGENEQTDDIVIFGIKI